MNRYVELIVTLALVVTAIMAYLYVSGFKAYLRLHISKLKFKKPVVFQTIVGVIMLIAITSNWFSQYYTVEIFSYLLNLTKGLESFTHTNRGVVDLNSGYQSIFEFPIGIINTLVRPVIAFLGVYFLYITLSYLLKEIYSKFKSVVTDRSVLTYYFFTGLLVQIFINTFLYAQSGIVLKNALVLSLESLVYITMGGLVLVYVRKKEILRYFDSHGGQLNTLEKRVLHNPLTLLVVGVFLYNVLLLPKNLGVIFYKSQTISFIILIVSVFGIAFAMRKWIFHNLLAALVDIVASSDKNRGFHQVSINNKVLKYLGGFLVLSLLSVFFISVSKLAFVFWLALFAGLFIGCIMLFLILVASIEGAFLSIGKERGIWKLPFKILKANYKFVCFSIFKSVSPLVIVLLVAFTLYTINPLPTENYNNMISNSLLDESGELVFVNFQDRSHPAVKVEGTEWLNRMVVAQEDDRFVNRENWFPSYNNMHGLNLTNFKGSNLLNQLIKNLSFTDSSDPFSALRKLVELSPSYMLSNKYSTNELLEMYNTVAGFGDGNGYRGAYLASYRLFNKPLNKLNQLEQLLLVETLKYSRGLTINKELILTDDFKERTNDIKEKLINKLIRFKNKGYITEMELRRTRRQPLRIDIQDLSSWAKNDVITAASMSTGSRLFINESEKESTSTTSISVKNLRASAIADSLFKIKMRRHLIQGDHRLMNFAIAVDIKKGKVIGHWGGNDVSSDYTTGADDLGFQFEAGSTMKPLFTALALDRGLRTNDRLYDGPMQGRFSPKNYNRYSYEKISIERALAKSCNICFANMPYVDYPETIKDLDVLLGEVGAEDGPHDINIILGYNNISIYNLARLYQALLNEGRLKNLDECPNCEVRSLPIFDRDNAKQVKQWLAATVQYGSAKHLKQILPSSDQFYAKTGTSNSATRGWTILANDDILIVSMVTYMDLGDRDNPFHNTPAIPGRSGGGSAGYFAAYLMNELLK